MRKIIPILILLIGCAKKETPTPIPPTHTPPQQQTNYFNSQFVQDNLIGNYNVYKETHIGNDTTYEYYLPTYIVIQITATTITHNPPATPEPYTYTNYNITSTNHHYIVNDMSEDATWLYIEVTNGSYITGFNRMFYSLSRI